MKIKLLHDAFALGTRAKFFKGHIYSAKVATNQPNWFRDEKIFVKRADEEYILLQKGDYIVTNGTWLHFAQIVFNG